MQIDFSKFKTRNNHRSLAIFIIIFFLILKILFLPFQSLSGDESYGVVLGRSLEMSYFDHPPLHQWIAHFSALIFGESEWARIPFILLFSLASWFIFLATELAFGAHAGLIAVFCLNVSWDMLTGAGARILPSNPLMFSFSLGLWALARLTLSTTSARHTFLLWLCIGLAMGLSALSKYHAIFFALGILIFFILSPHQRKWFRHPAPYFAAILAICLVAPVIIWNWQNDWASIRFQGSRLQPGLNEIAGATQSTSINFKFNYSGPIEVIWALVGKLTPWIFLPLSLAFINAIRYRRRDDKYLIFGADIDSRKRLDVSDGYSETKKSAFQQYSTTIT